MNLNKTYWFHAILALVLTILAGAILLPLVRSHPKSVHDFMSELHALQRSCLIFFLSSLFVFTLFQLLTPQVSHLRNITTHPPAWIGVLLGVVAIALIDLVVGLSPQGYEAKAWEWIVYAGGGALLVVAYNGTWEGLALLLRSKANGAADAPSESPPRLDSENIASVQWEFIEAWLMSDAPAEDDLLALGHRAVAERLAEMIIDGTRSIGIVAPFGAGKTSLVNWIVERIKQCETSSTKFIVSSHSCWGFETSASAIHNMLNNAVQKIGEEVDVFHVRSLPDSYRKTFSAGGNLVDALSDVVLSSQRPLDQFDRLSRLLSELNLKLVFIVEDLDRNDTREFEIQEVLAFLERIKNYPNISFILTGGQYSSRQIDFAKLCDHFERLRSIQPTHASSMVMRVRDRCLDQSVFPCEYFGKPDGRYGWSPLGGMFMRDYHELSFPQAVAALLSTPRSLRHALNSTYFAWRQGLAGEIDLDHLLAVNVLRFGAPECFNFLDRRWERLHATASQDPIYGQERIEKIRQAVIDDWNNTVRDVEWNPTAARKVMEEILPTIAYWLVDSSSSGGLPTTLQGVHKERYWLRAVNNAVEEGSVRDQEVVRQIQRWMDTPHSDAELVLSLAQCSAFVDVWEDVAMRYFASKPELVLKLSEHVISKVLEIDGADASEESQGLGAIWSLRKRPLPQRPENRNWLEARISHAAKISIRMVYDLWYCYGPSGSESILLPDDVPVVRQHIIHSLKSTLVDGRRLGQLLSPKNPYVFYQLIFDPRNGVRHDNTECAAWTWLSPLLIDSLKQDNRVVAVGIASLISQRNGGEKREPLVVDPEILFNFFPESASEVISLLSGLAGRIEAQEQRQLVESIVNSARRLPNWGDTESAVAE